MSDVDNDWFLFNLFHHLDWASEQGETLQNKPLIQFAIVTRISTFDILSYSSSRCSLYSTFYSYTIFIRSWLRSRGFWQALSVGFCSDFLIFTFLFCIIFFESFPVLHEKFSWKQKQFYVLGWGLHWLKIYKGKLKIKNLSEVIMLCIDE